MRLIDADAFIKYANEKLDLTADELTGMINEQPTAYDVEKVVNQMEVTKKTALDKVRMLFRVVTKRDLQGVVNICFDEAIKIARIFNLKLHSTCAHCIFFNRFNIWCSSQIFLQIQPIDQIWILI